MRIKKVKSSTGDGIVRGFHFICPTEKDVHLNPDGTFWTGTWVVAEGHAEMAPKVGAYVALHTEHASNSYRYGVVKDWRLEKRKEAYVDGQKVKTDKGIDFLIEPTDESVPWRGHGIVEKSYYYGE